VREKRYWKIPCQPFGRITPIAERCRPVKAPLASGDWRRRERQNLPERTPRPRCNGGWLNLRHLALYFQVLTGQVAL